MESDKSTKKKVLMEVALVAEVLQQYHSNLMGGHSGVNSTWAGYPGTIPGVARNKMLQIMSFLPSCCLPCHPPCHQHFHQHWEQREKLIYQMSSTFSPTLGTERKADISDVILISETPRKTRRMEVPVTKWATCNHEVAQLQLSMSTDDSWLDNGHIDHAQAFLSHQYPQIGGFQSACVFKPEGCQQVGKPEGHFVQILNLPGNHWATVSNINCPKDTVAVYDSMNNSPPSAGKNKLLKHLACLVVPKKTLKIEWVDIQKKDWYVWLWTVCHSSCDIPVCSCLSSELYAEAYSEMFSRRRDESFSPTRESTKWWGNVHWECCSLLSLQKTIWTNEVLVECVGCFDCFHHSCESAAKKKKDR